jgi:hypothetical protein
VNQVVAHWNLAQALRDSGEYSRAEGAFFAVLALQEDMWGAHVQV